MERQTIEYVVEKRCGGPIIERLSPASLAAAAGVTGRTVQELLAHNGYQPEKIGSDDALGG